MPNINDFTPLGVDNRPLELVLSNNQKTTTARFEKSNIVGFPWTLSVSHRNRTDVRGQQKFLVQISIYNKDAALQFARRLASSMFDDWASFDEWKGRDDH